MERPNAGRGGSTTGLQAIGNDHKEPQEESCTPKPAAKPIQTASVNDGLESASNPMKMLMQTAISMIKHSRP